MNIFEVLNSGKSRLYEPSLSSILGYLLDSKENHGLGKTFIQLFLQLINDNEKRDIFGNEYFHNSLNSDVLLEEPYKLGAKRCDVDIQISLLDSNNNETFRIIIENKVRASSASPFQLSDYYKAVVNNDPNLKNLLFIFLTPYSNNKKLVAEYNNLKITNTNHNKTWLYWSQNEHALINLFQNLLSLELKAEINPINEYLRHTIKAFINFVSDLTNTKQKIRYGEDIGDIRESKDVKVGKKVYTIVRRSSNQIQVFEDGEKMIAKEILRKVINKYNLNIPTNKTYSLTTRELGKLILSKIK